MPGKLPPFTAGTDSCCARRADRPWTSSKLRRRDRAASNGETGGAWDLRAEVAADGLVPPDATDGDPTDASAIRARRAAKSSLLSSSSSRTGYMVSSTTTTS